MKYFKEEEFNMNGEIVFDKMNVEFLEFLDFARGYIKKPFVLTSTYRSEEYNKMIGGAENSQHILGRASDISTKGWTGADKAKLVKLALDSGMSVGIDKNFIHIDNRITTQVIWTY